MLNLHRVTTETEEQRKNREALCRVINLMLDEVPRNRGAKVAAIKIVRNLTDFGLKEAKDWVDTYFGECRGQLCMYATYTNPDASREVAEKWERLSLGDVLKQELGKGTHE